MRDPECAVLRFTIEGVEPLIWRRVIVPRDWRLGDLHRLIQATFGWPDLHSHEFILSGLSFSDSPGPPEAGAAGLRVYDEDDVRLRDMLGRDIEFSYVYEVGEHWLVAIVLEDLLWNERGPNRARCVDGARAAPGADSEGPEAYAALLAAMRDLGGAHRRSIGWPSSVCFQSSFDPEVFDLDGINRHIAEIGPPKRDGRY